MHYLKMVVATNEDFANSATGRYECNLSAILYTFRWVFQHNFGDRWLLYAPDRVGMPVLVSQIIHEIFESFGTGAVVADVISVWERNKLV
jgi:hypothetical protein